MLSGSFLPGTWAIWTWPKGQKHSDEATDFWRNSNLRNDLVKNLISKQAVRKANDFQPYSPIMGKYLCMFWVRFPSIICQWKTSCNSSEVKLRDYSCFVYKVRFSKRLPFAAWYLAFQPSPVLQPLQREQQIKLTHNVQRLLSDGSVSVLPWWGESRKYLGSVILVLIGSINPVIPSCRTYGTD